MAATIAQGFGFTVDFLTAGNTLRIFKVRKFSVDSKNQQARGHFMNNAG